MPHLTSQQKAKKLNKILSYVRLSHHRYKKYPTLEFIEKKFHTNLRTYNLNIRKLYKLANVLYKRDPNPFLRYEKEKKLADITKKLFTQSGYKIKNISIGPSKPRGADIIVEDKRKRLIPVEIKAYQKFGKLGSAKYSPYIRDEILQLKRYIKHLHAPYGYLITSTDQKVFRSTPPNIKILFGKDLEKFLSHFNMYKELRDLNWIRNSSISYGKEELYKKIRNKILKLVKKEVKKGRYVSNDKVVQKFKVHVESYFPGGMTEIYQKLNTNLDLFSNSRMGGNVNKKSFKAKVVHFIKDEVGNNRYPTYKAIQKQFHFLPTLFFLGGIREMYKMAGIKYYRKFATKTPKERESIRQKVIQYAIQKLKNDFYPGYRDVESKFHINFQYYFKNPEELYQKAGYNGSVKKTWKNSGRKI